MITEEDIQKYLEHHGVKGMRWGVRRNHGLGTSSKSQSRTSADYKATAEFRKRHPATLSNKQLQRVNERMNLEKNFSRLNPNKLAEGKKQALKILSALAVEGASVAAVTYLKSDAGKRLIQAGLHAIKH